MGKYDKDNDGIILTKKDITWEYVNIMVFRGDSRHYSRFFKNGAFPRNKFAKDDAVYISQPFESAANNVIACTKRFRAAAMFPLDKNVSSTWVYIFKPIRIFDVKKSGYHYFGNEINESGSFGLFLDELITDYIPPQNIIGAVKIIRKQYNDLHRLPDYLKKPYDQLTIEDDYLIDFYFARGIYTVGDYVPNEGCHLSDEDKKLARWFVSKEQHANKYIEHAYKLPMPQSGYFVRPKPLVSDSNDNNNNHTP